MSLLDRPPCPADGCGKELCFEHDRETGETYCPHCREKHRGDLLSEEVQVLQQPRARNALSRRAKVYICRLCGIAEAFADMYGGMTDTMARRVVQNEINEVARLGPGAISPMKLQYVHGVDRIEGSVDELHGEAART